MPPTSQSNIFFPINQLDHLLQFNTRSQSPLRMSLHHIEEARETVVSLKQFFTEAGSYLTPEFKIRACEAIKDTKALTNEERDSLIDRFFCHVRIANGLANVLTHGQDHIDIDRAQSAESRTLAARLKPVTKQSHKSKTSSSSVSPSDHEEVDPSGKQTDLTTSEKSHSSATAKNLEDPHVKTIQTLEEFLTHCDTCLTEKFLGQACSDCNVMFTIPRSHLKGTEHLPSIDQARRYAQSVTELALELRSACWDVNQNTPDMQYQKKEGATLPSVLAKLQSFMLRMTPDANSQAPPSPPARPGE